LVVPVSGGLVIVASFKDEPRSAAGSDVAGPVVLFTWILEAPAS
jgi:hypothetical protein